MFSGCFKKSDRIFIAGTAFALGIVFASINMLLAVAVWIVALFFIVLARDKADWAFLILTFSLGIFYILIRSPSLDQGHISYFAGKEATFSGIVAEEPEQDGDNQKLIVRADKMLASSKVEPINGKILLTVKSFPRYEYGDRLAIVCKAEAMPDSGFYVEKGVFSQCNFPSVKLLAKNQASFIKFWLFKIKRNIIERLNSTIREPHASLLAGILVGARSNLPSDLSEEFKRAGVIHIVAMSGYNITVVGAMILQCLFFLRVRRQHAFWFVVGGICCFMILTGMSASVVRAGIMGIVVLLAKQLGQIAKIKNILIVTLVGMLLAEPLVWKNIGFQLSFLSTIGLIYFAPRIYKYFCWIPEKLAFRDNVVSSCAAISLTLPLTIFYFGQFSVVALVVNFLVLSTIPIIMLVGFIQLNVSFVSMAAAKIVGLATFVLLDYVIRVVHVYAALPWAALRF